MRALSYCFVRDRGNLDALVMHYPILAPLKDALKSSYRTYVRQKASNPIAPLNISRSQVACLGKAYENHSAAASLSWINELRIHGLKSCPMCGGLGAGTLDHYLPQAHYPEFSVFSLNLMPSCGSCNTKRNDCNAPGVVYKTLHLYFDRKILSRLEVFTRIDLQGGVPAFQPLYNRSCFDPDEQARIDEHFEKSIDELAYFNFNVAELEIIKERISFCVGVDEVRKALSDEARVQSKSPNSWGHMLCTGLLALSDEEMEVLLDLHPA